MRNFKSFALAAFALLTLPFLAPATPAHAQHPGYLHAISDLRAAREYLRMDDRREMRRASEYAINEISQAIDDMRRAAREDGRNPWRMPPPQAEGNPERPIHSAMRLMREARRDIEQGRGMRENEGLRDRSLAHIDRALHELERFR